MARKADEDLLAELDQLGAEETPAPAPSTKPAASKTGTVKKSAAAPKPAAAAADEEDALADLEKQLAAKPATAASSRPTTPRVNSSSKVPAAAERVSTEAQVRSSGDGGSRSFHQGVSAAAEEKDKASSSGGGGGGGGGAWSWGSSIFSAATAAVKQAETLASQISGNEEAQRWAEQVRGNMRGLQEFGTDLRSRALPTFTSLISHIAPPISSHERLQIHTTHDIQNYPSLDPIIYAPFARIMAQVEGGDLIVLQRGTESRARNSSDESAGYRGRILGGSAPASWTDGPWWRDEANGTRSLGAVAGLREGTRLARVSAEAYAKEFFDASGGVEAAAKRATESLSESNPVRSSDIFLAIQPVRYTPEADLFASSAEVAAGEKKEKDAADKEDDAEVIVFAVYLHDPIHSLAFRSLSQPFPARWAAWLDGEGGLPESITDIIHAGGVDPRDWIAEWMEETLSLAVGIVAQQYVAKRMGVGERTSGAGEKEAATEAA